MLRSACWLIAVAVGLALGCSTMRPSGASHPGITDLNPKAVSRIFPNASATLVARKMEAVMAEYSILDKVELTPDIQSKEYRYFSRADRQALGISMMTPANDVNFNLKAKSKDGKPVAVVVRLKGETGVEVSVLYGFAGDPDFSRDLLDQLAASLDRPEPDPALVKTSDPKAAKSESGRRSR